ncbi:MAG: FAD-binding oxidoreductase [Actinobacteria bacterium]|nr:FAD-binding oxidoreductase [Actinomycetota bacterium]
MTGTVSYWLADAEDGRSPRAPLDGDRSADVVVVGGGFTGLWTAWELLRREPSLDVVVLEAETVGFGASGRNGGWCSPGLGVSVAELARRTSPETARWTVEVLRATVDEVGRLTAEAGLDIGFRKGGILRVARGPHEVPSMHATLDDLAALGLAGGCDVLSPSALAERVHVAGALGALWDPHGAVLHPGRLVRGLARLVEDAGGTVHEGTTVERVEPGAHPAVVTPQGRVRASTVVLATEAWLSQLPGWTREVLPVYSLVVLTEPVPDELADRIGWKGDECLSSHRATVDYLSRTPDGRILFGGRGAPYHFGSAIDPAYDTHEETHAMLRRMLVDWFPDLGDIRFDAAWGGALGMPRDFMPSMWHDPATGIAAAYGYTGQGVTTARLSGRVLTDLILDGETPLADLPMVGHRPRRWEPEPLRWLGARLVQRGLQAVDDRAERTGEPPTGRTLAERLIRH